MTARASSVGLDRQELAAQVVGVVLSALPSGAISRGELSAMLAEIATGPASLRGLLAYLENHPDALRSGRSDGPPIRLRLLEHLAVRAPDAVVLPRCVSCQRPKPLFRKLGGQRCCTTCWAKAKTEVCVRCDEERSVAKRELAGGAVCARCDRRDTSRWEPCIDCGKVRLPAARTPRGPQCQNCIPRRLYTCARCNRDRPAHAIHDEGPICGACYRRTRTTTCTACGENSSEVKHRADVDARLCEPCWIPPVMTCTSCGEDKPIRRGIARGKPICESCRSGNRPIRTCAACGNERRIHTRLLMGPACAACYTRMRNEPAVCAGCGLTRPLNGRDDRHRPICGPCAGEKFDWICGSCGDFAALYADGNCPSCTARTGLHALCSTADGEIHPQLRALLAAIDTDQTARAVIGWLRETEAAKLIRDLANSGAPITHDLLDELPATRAVTNVRGLLVETGALEPRHDDVERTAKWIDTRLRPEPTAIGRIVRPYATWHVLGRARKNGTRSRSAGRNARARINVAILFLNWLDSRGQTLGTATQSDVDEWLIGGKTTRYLIRGFVLWAHGRGLCAELNVPWRPRDEPINYLTDHQRQELLAAVLQEPDLPLQLRAAAALLLTFGLTPTAIVGLRTTDVTRSNGHTFLRVGRRPLVMPGELGKLIDQLAAEAPQHRHTLLAPTGQPNQWLFPGTVPGRAADPGRLATILKKRLGLPTRHARNTAISALALDLPSTVLAGLLGIQIGTAIRWTKLVKADWGDYLAQRAKAVDK